MRQLEGARNSAVGHRRRTIILVMMVRWLQPEFERPELKSREGDLSDVRMRLGELDQLKQRISELEERVDFAERLLAQQREGQRLGPPQG